MPTTKNALFRETWYDVMSLLRVTCDASCCLIELTVKGDKTTDRVTLEILQQARDERGLPLGPAVVIHRQAVPCDYLPERQTMIGQAWLPGRLASPHIRNCYFRLRSNLSDPPDG